MGARMGTFVMLDPNDALPHGASIRRSRIEVRTGEEQRRKGSGAVQVRLHMQDVREVSMYARHCGGGRHPYPWWTKDSEVGPMGSLSSDRGGGENRALGLLGPQLPAANSR
jgi:hypothetical protein